MRPELPAGTVTFLFTDVEGSTRLLHQLGADGYARALAEHRRVLREAFGAHGGVEVDTQGDAFFVAFPTAPGALQAAAAALEGLAPGPIRVRMGIHTGTPHLAEEAHLAEEGYVGEDVHKGARIAAAGHGGQVLVSASTAALAGTDGMRDLGEHRLKDLSAPERVYQLGDADFPPLKSLNATNLPVAANPLVGRKRELAELQALLHDSARLVTLTGAGGSGKTRLGLQVAAELVDDFEGGVFFVPLAGVSEPDLVPSVIATTVGVREPADLRDQEALLLVDNFEHLLDAAPAIRALLSAAPNTKVLVTSRAPLRVEGELEYAVEPLPEDDAVALLTARARAVRGDFVPDGVALELCRRLDGLPLALELAASRLRSLGPEALLSRLERRLPLLTGGRRDAPERQRTLRATIEWSHDLLRPELQRLFARLAVFAGTFSLEAAETVLAGTVDELHALVEDSLLKAVGQDRFFMLETIREFAAERLDEGSEAAVLRSAHAEYFLALAEQADVAHGHNLGRELDLLEQEHDNLRVALDTFERIGETGRTVQLTAELAQFWFIRGHSGDARKRLPAALEADSRPSVARATVLRSAAIFALDEGDPARAERLATESIAISRDLGDQSGEARGLIFLAQSFADRGDPEHACSLAAESARVFEELGEDDLHRHAMHEFGWMSFLAGDVERSRSVHEQNLERARSADDSSLTAASLELLALIAAREGRSDDAKAMLRESFEINRALGYSFGIAFDLDYLGAAAVAQGSPELAARLLGRAEALRTEIGAHIRGADSVVNDQTVRAIRSELDDEALAAALEAGRTLELDEAVALGLADGD